MTPLADQWAGTRWVTEPHIRFGDPCYDCAVPMTPASRWWSALTIPEGMRKHAGLGLCSRCANRRRRNTANGGIAFWLAAIVAVLGVVALGWTHPAIRPDGVTLLGVLGVVAAIAVLWVLQATVRGYWVLEGSGRRRTKNTLKATRQTEGNAHHQDAAS